jgi:hypothetical protein
MSHSYYNDNLDLFEEEFLVAVAALDDEGKHQKRRYNHGCGCITVTLVVTIAITALFVMLIAL